LRIDGGDCAHWGPRYNGEALGRASGRGAPKRLRGGGVVRQAFFAQALSNAWAR
jgi:hypothetical protein